jgi:hypothetical protein
VNQIMSCDVQDLETLIRPPHVLSYGGMLRGPRLGED